MNEASKCSNNNQEIFASTDTKTSHNENDDVCNNNQTNQSLTKNQPSVITDKLAFSDACETIWYGYLQRQ